MYVGTMNWNKITSDTQLDTIKEESAKQPVLIFKHSTTCSISAMALSRMERNWNDQLGVKPYYLDLLANRPISNKIEHLFGVEHESPQVLLIRNGACVYDASHMAISFAGIQQAV
ncbi:bacillithiol system redox-active protein YtxJ [Spirosoma aerophilum]